MNHTISWATGRQGVSGKACRAKQPVGQGPLDVGRGWGRGGRQEGVKAKYPGTILVASHYNPH